MLRKMTVCSFVLSLVAFASAASPDARPASSAPPAMTAERIIEKNVAARGGLQAWHAVQAIEMHGQLDAGKGTQLPFTLRLKRPRKMRLEVEFQDKTAVQIYDGTRGWKVRPFLGRTTADPFTKDELKQASLQSDLDGPLFDYVAKGTKITYDGTDDVNGTQAYRLRLTEKDGTIRHLWVDSKSFLELKLDGRRRVEGRDRIIQTFYRDYKPVNGLMMPFKYETAVQGNKEVERIIVDKIAVNPKVADNLFAEPK